MVDVHSHLITLYFANAAYEMSVFGDFTPVLHQFVNYFAVMGWVHVPTQAVPPYNRSYRLVYSGGDWVVGGVLLRFTLLLEP